MKKANLPGKVIKIIKQLKLSQASMAKLNYLTYSTQHLHSKVIRYEYNDNEASKSCRKTY